MTERELRADLRVLVQRWETAAAQARADNESAFHEIVFPSDAATVAHVDTLNDCIDDVKELLV